MARARHRLASVRKVAGLSQEALAEAVGVERTTVMRWEHGDTTPQPWSRPRLARALGVSNGTLAELLSDEPEIENRQPGSGLTVEEVDALYRRDFLRHSLAAIAFPVLGFDDAAYTPAIPSSAAYSPSRLTLAELPTTSWAAPIYDAVLDPVGAAQRAVSEANGAAGRRPGGLPELRRNVDKAMYASLSADYTQLVRLLPGLIGCAESANIGPSGSDQFCVLWLLSDVYALAGWTLIKADSPVGAWVAAQRAVRVAEQAGDVLRVAAATRCLAEVHMRAGNFAEATRTAFLAAVHLDGTGPTERSTTLCLRGAALLSAAAAAARGGDSREAYAALRAASVCAGELDEDRSDLGNMFGPTNVAIHQVAVAVELGNAREAVRHVPTVRLDQMPVALTERRARFLIDVARSHAQLKDDSAALDALIQAERAAPDELRKHRLTQELLPKLLSRERCMPELRALAARCHLQN